MIITTWLLNENSLLQKNNIIWCLARDAETECPVSYVESNKNDGEHNAAVLVNITAPHAIDGVGRVEDVRPDRLTGVVELWLAHGGHHWHVVMVDIAVRIVSVVGVKVNHVA